MILTISDLFHITNQVATILISISSDVQTHVSAFHCCIVRRIYHQLPNSCLFFPQGCLPPASDNEVRSTDSLLLSALNNMMLYELLLLCQCWGGDNTHLQSIAGALLQIQLILTPHCRDAPAVLAATAPSLSLLCFHVVFLDIQPPLLLWLFSSLTPLLFLLFFFPGTYLLSSRV